MYSLKSEQYEYFQYDKEFATKKKKSKVKKPTNPRKDGGLEFSIGLTGSALNVTTGFELDTNFVEGLLSRFDETVGLKIGASKYFNLNSSAGLTAEYSIINSEVRYFNLGARYQYLYNPTKNAAFYFPPELKFSHYQSEHYYQVDEVGYTNERSYWPKEIDALVTINALELNLGQGVSFALANKRSVSLEFMLLNQFILSEKVEIPSDNRPITEYGVNGLKLSVSMNF